MTSGPMAKVSRNILSVMARIVSLVMSSFAAIVGSPGAIMELANGVKNV